VLIEFVIIRINPDRMRKIAFTVLFITLLVSVSGQIIEKEFRIEKQYLNFPIEMKQDRQKVHFLMDRDTLTFSVIRIADKEPDYWVFKDVSAYKGKNIKLVFSENVRG
jgi:fructan beta-fructosidase